MAISATSWVTSLAFTTISSRILAQDWAVLVPSDRRSLLHSHHTLRGRAALRNNLLHLLHAILQKSGNFLGRIAAHLGEIATSSATRQTLAMLTSARSLYGCG